MEAKYIGAIIGFILGIVGYPLAKFWIIPIIRFKRVRNRAVRLMSCVEGTFDSGRLQESMVVELRQINANLLNQYNRLHPAYRAFLAKKGVSIDGACKHLLTLSNVRNAGHARNHILKVIDCLKG